MPVVCLTMFSGYLFCLYTKFRVDSPTNPHLVMWGSPTNPHLVMWGLVRDLYSSIVPRGGAFYDSTLQIPTSARPGVGGA